jgi:hypothetical protein
VFDWHHKIPYFHLATKHHPVPVITSQCTRNSNGAQIAAIQQSAYGTANLTVRIYFQTTVGNLFLFRRLVAVDQMGEDIIAKRFVCKEIRRERESPDQNQEHLMNWKEQIRDALAVLPADFSTKSVESASCRLHNCVENSWGPTLKSENKFQ